MLSNDINSVRKCLLHQPWRTDAHGGGSYVKFIGSIGVIACVPGRPHKWYQMIRNTLKQYDYCCEHNIDWWFKPLRGISNRTGLVYYGCEVRITQEILNTIHSKTTQYITTNRGTIPYNKVDNLFTTQLNLLR